MFNSKEEPVEEPYSLKEEILSSCTNDFVKFPFFCVYSVRKPEIFFDHNRFFKENNISSLRFTDDFIYEIVMGKNSIYPSSLNQNKYVLSQSFFNSNFSGIIELEDLIRLIYKHSFPYVSGDSIHSGTLVLDLINSGKTLFTMNDINFIANNEENISDTLIDICYVSPENCYISTIKKLIEYSQDFDDSELKKSFKTFSEEILTNNNLFQKSKYISVKYFIKSISYSDMFLFRDQIRQNTHMNLYMLQNNITKKKLQFYDKNINEYLINMIFSKLKDKKTKSLDYLEKFIDKSSKIYYEMSYENLRNYFLSFCASCMVNCSFNSKILKKGNDGFRSLKCYRLMIDHFYGDSKRNFETDLILASICCSFFNANSLSELHFSDCFMYLDTVSTYQTMNYVFCDMVCEQLECFFNCDEIQDDRNNYEFIESTRFYSSITKDDLIQTLKVMDGEKFFDKFIEISDFLNSETIDQNKTLNCEDLSISEFNLFCDILDKLDQSELRLLKNLIIDCNSLDGLMSFILFPNLYNRLLNEIPFFINSFKTVSLSEFSQLIDKKEMIDVDNLIFNLQDKACYESFTLKSVDKFLNIFLMK